MKHLVTIFLLAIVILSHGQISGDVNYEQIGVSFTIPEGWSGQESNGMLILGSNTIPGLIILAEHNYTIEQLKVEAQKGLNLGNGANLSLSGQLANLSSNAVGGEFDGTLEYQQAKAYIIGVANPHGGTGATIMAVTNSSNYTKEHEEVCKTIQQSFRFKKIDHSAKIKEWQDWLSNVRLTYMNSSYSPSYSSGGISGAYSSETKIDLCSNGSFSYSGNSDVSVSGDGVSGYNAEQNAGQGKWSVEPSSSGNYNLVLKYHNGQSEYYTLEYKDSKLYLNGYRYFRTTEGEYAPNCY